jgi:hypothetical protein
LAQTAEVGQTGFGHSFVIITRVRSSAGGSA